VFPNIQNKELKNISKNMWNNYGRVFAEYMFIKEFRSGSLKGNIKIKGEEILKQIKKENKNVIFVSGHFSNFELMAMEISKCGIDLCAIYRPLNNIYLNPIMENIRKKYICEKQIKKGMSGTRELVSLLKKNYSAALMLDQRVSQGIKSKFFNQEAFTTTIPAQIAKKYNLPVVPIFIERLNGIDFTMKVYDPIYFSTNQSTSEITRKLNLIIEKMIIKNPNEWIWTHNRWK
jgi:KDO2-lipid IV(A) lauroyltransferase